MTSFFPMGSFGTCRIPFGMLGLNLLALRLLCPLLLGSSFPWQPDFGRCRVRGEPWDRSNLPWHPALWGNCKVRDSKLPRNLQKREFFLASRETRAYKLEIHVPTFDFLLLKHTLGLHLAWAQLLVVYIGYWLFTLGQYTGRAVYTRPATNSTVQFVSTTAALLYLQSWKEIKIWLWK